MNLSIDSETYRERVLCRHRTAAPIRSQAHGDRWRRIWITAFAFYGARIPENLRKEFGHQDSVYWRSPEPKLAVCFGCHEKGTAPTQ